MNTYSENESAKAILASIKVRGAITSDANVLLDETHQMLVWHGGAEFIVTVKRNNGDPLTDAERINHRLPPKPTVEFEHSVYERSHMKAPRGRGSWAFAFMTGERGWDEGANVYFSPGGMLLSEAKKWFRENFSVPSHVTGVLTAAVLP